ncbi:MAG: hypothetical protein O2958_11535 [Gemmatimonadetes bacterium]|nr:hypothetical protein [Gemmatimonadota bacterium]MDA1104824.1 hypothetical protein [Gemmatimonadota bacterium]
MIAALVLAGLLLMPADVMAAPQLRYDVEYPAIGYSERARTDRVADLREALAEGRERLSFDPRGGYLTSLLESLDIPVSSQMLVFTKTSFQGHLVSPERPRAIYFNDDVYVAYVQGSEVLELSAIDPVLGGVFYSLEQRPDAPASIAEESDLCLGCHDSFGLSGGGVPRHLVGSMLPDENGMSVTHEGWSLTDDRTPLRRRWGGWYVTGTHGTQEHRGNVIVRSPADVPTLDFGASGNRVELEGLVDVAPYPTPHSDIVALMVLEHQVHVQNLITRMNYDVRSALHAERLTDEVVAKGGEPLVEAMLFRDEAAVRDAIAGTSSFTEDFEARGPRDDQGRSLRDLDLTTRLFRYPLSYLIYSESFAALPDVARRYVYRRLYEVLTDSTPGPAYAHLTDTDRRAILGILLDTDPAFANLGLGRSLP